MLSRLLALLAALVAYAPASCEEMDNSHNAIGSLLAAGGVATVAIYFPGFHHSVDNDMLWGERWMEWDNLMAGNTTPLEYDSLARQPLLHPQRGYYDIWDAHARTIHSQAREAAAAGFKAFMFYHYWFAHGQRSRGPLRPRSSRVVQASRAASACPSSLVGQMRHGRSAGT